MTTPTITPTPSPLPNRSQDKTAFNNAVDSYMTWLEANADELNILIPWIVQSRDDVIAAALAGNLPSLAGFAGQIVVVSPAEDGVVFAPLFEVPSFAGNAGKPVVVNGTEDGIEYGVQSGSRVLIDRLDRSTMTGTGGGSASGTGYTWPLFDDTLYSSYEFVIENWLLSTGGTFVNLQFSADGGVSYGNENLLMRRVNGTNSGTAVENNLMAGDSTNSNIELFSGKFSIERPKDVQKTYGRFEVTRTTQGPGIALHDGFYIEQTLQAIDGLQTLTLTGSTPGTPTGFISMYGFRV